jgi:hypothetical protein
MVSLAQAAGCPWETMIELGHWKGATMGGAFVLPAEDLRRKKGTRVYQLARTILVGRKTPARRTYHLQPD